MKNIFLLLFFFILSFSSHSKQNEKFYSDKFCVETLFGETQFEIIENNKIVAYVDCKTKTQAVEFGWSDGDIYNDIGQSLYYSIKTGKSPTIILLIDKLDFNNIIRKTKQNIKKFEDVNKAFNLNINLILLEVPDGKIINKEDLK